MIKLLGLIFLSLVANVYLSTKWLNIVNIPVKIPKLPKIAAGFKILQLSDLHSNSITKMNIDIWKAIKDLNFDIVVITGDIVNSNVNELKPHFNNIKELSAKIPIYFCDGNHDHLAGFDSLKLQLENAGVIVLNNKKVDIKDPISHELICELIGLSDYKHSNYEEISKMFASYDADIVKIVIAHEPQSFYEVRDYLPSLTIAGHTHGGQLRLPFFKTIYAPGQGFFPKYGYGLYDYLGSKLFISKGIGHTFFKIRFWNRPEIVILELT